MLKTILMRPAPRFIYLNIYSFLLVLAGILALAIPFYKFTKWTLLVQAIAALKLFEIAYKLFLTYEDKLTKINILTGKNKTEFRPDTFSIFMQAPCSRLVAYYVLIMLDKTYEYKNLLKLKKSFLENLKDNCTASETVVFINEEAFK